MNPPIEVEFVWDEDHYARSIRAYLSGRRQRLITALFMLFAAYLVYAAIVVFRHAWPLAALYVAMAAMLLILRGPWKRILMPGLRGPEPSLPRSHPATEERIVQLRELQGTPASQRRFHDNLSPQGLGTAVTTRPRNRVLGYWY